MFAGANELRGTVMSIPMFSAGASAGRGAGGDGVVAAFVAGLRRAVAALHGPRAQHGPAPVALAPLPVRNGSAVNIGRYSPPTIRLSIGLKPPHRAAEQRFLRAIQTKSSPLFHHYLTTAEWTKRFGPTAASQAAVVVGEGPRA